MNLAGVGGRVSVNIAPIVQLEGEVAYDFSQAFTEGFTDNSVTPGTVTLVRTNTRVVHGLFGPKLQTNRGPVRLASHVWPNDSLLMECARGGCELN